MNSAVGQLWPKAFFVRVGGGRHRAPISIAAVEMGDQKFTPPRRHGSNASESLEPRR